MMTKTRIFCLAAAIVCFCLNMVAQTAFEASRVEANVVSKRKDLYLLGKNEHGQQIWYGQFNFVSWKASEDIRYVNGSDIELKIANYNTTRHNGRDANERPLQFLRKDRYGIGMGSDGCIFELVIGETHLMNFMAYFDNNHTEKINNCIENGIRLYAKTNLIAQEPVLNKTLSRYTQTLKWNVSPITDSTLQKVDIMASFDNGESWQTMYTSNHCSGSFIQQLPHSVDSVQYKAVASIREKYKPYFMEDLSQLTSQTPIYILKRFAMPAVMSVDNIRKDFTDNKQIDGRSYAPTVTWNINTYIAYAFGSGVLECCPYKTGGHWQKLADITSASGSLTVNTPVGCDSLLFRLTVKPKSTMKQFDDSTTTVLLATTPTSAPEFTQIALEETLNNCFDAETNSLTPTLTYAMNDDLYQTRLGAAYIYYSTDFGNTWTLAKTVKNPQQNGSVRLSIPASASVYMFRIFMANMIDNAIATNEITSEPTSYSETLVLDDAVAYQPINSYDRQVKVLRSFGNGRIGTICLPFALTADQIAAGFGAEAEVYEYTSLTGTVMNFTKVDNMEAGHPYLIRTVEDKDYLVFNNVYIDDETLPLPSDISTDYVFSGTFGPYLMKGDGTELFLATDGKLKYPSSTDGQANKLRGYRAFFQIANNTADEAKININGDVTSLSLPIADMERSTKIYNLNGQCVGNSLNTLPNGVYIMNGKKIIK